LRLLVSVLRLIISCSLTKVSYEGVPITLSFAEDNSVTF